MWYSGCSADWQAAVIGLANSADGITWERDTVNSPVLTNGSGGDWDNLRVFASAVIARPDTFFLIYVGRNSTDRFQIGLAVSVDSGVTWEKYAGNPVLSPSAGQWDGTDVGLGSGSVIWEGDTLYVWYSGWSATTRAQIGLASAWFPTPTTVATIHRVPSDYATIQSAIDACIDGDTVLVADGLYYENISFLGKAIVVGSLYLITGDTSHIAATIIDGSHAADSLHGSVVSFISGEDTTSVLCGFTIQGGKGTYFSAGTLLPVPAVMGGGVLCFEAGARLVRNVITENNISGENVYGGGVAALISSASMVIMEHNIVSDNSVFSERGEAVGAGIDMWQTDAIIRNNVVMGNSAITTASSIAGSGGGAYLNKGSFIVEDNTFAGNSVTALNAVNTAWACSGGGVIAWDGSFEFRGNIFAANLVQSGYVNSYGGGLAIGASGSAYLRDVLVTGNRFAANEVSCISCPGLSSGGGIHVRNQRPRIENNIIVNNTAPFGGGFSAIQRETGVVGAPVLINNTIAGNRATSGDGGGIATSGQWTPIVMNTIAWGDTGISEILVQSGSISVVYSDIQGSSVYPGEGNINADPKFSNVQYGLYSTSPCLETAIDSIQINGVWYHAPSFCFYGTPRPSPQGTRPDMGACENPIAVDVTEVDGRPTAFALLQNYPNPFNPSTTIEYALPHSGFVTLKVYNVLGEEVATLLNEDHTAGTFKATWDASVMPSGIYFYRLTAGTFGQTKKMVLMK